MGCCDEAGYCRYPEQSLCINLIVNSLDSTSLFHVFRPSFSFQCGWGCYLPSSGKFIFFFHSEAHKDCFADWPKLRGEGGFIWGWQITWKMHRKRVHSIEVHVCINVCDTKGWINHGLWPSACRHMTSEFLFGKVLGASWRSLNLHSQSSILCICNVVFELQARRCGCVAAIDPGTCLAELHVNEVAASHRQLLLFLFLWREWEMLLPFAGAAQPLPGGGGCFLLLRSTRGVLLTCRHLTLGIKLWLLMSQEAKGWGQCLTQLSTSSPGVGQPYGWLYLLQRNLGSA